MRELSLPLASDTLLGAAAKSRATWSGASDAHADDHMIFSHFGGDPPQRVVAVPLLARGKAVAVLYADCAEMDSDAINLEALETIVRVSGMAVELLAAGRPAAESAAPHEATNATPAGTAAADPAPAASWEGADPTIVEPYGQPLGEGTR